MRGRKKRTTTTDCIAVRRIFEAAGLCPQSIIKVLERATQLDDVFLSTYRTDAIVQENIPKQIEVVQMEKENIYAQMLISVLKIALMEGKYFNYSNPSLN